MTNPHDRLLDRDQAKVLMAESYSSQLSALEDIVNYGTMLLVRCLHQKPQPELVEQVVIANFGKHLVAMLDGIHVMLTQGAVIPAQATLRTAFECHMYALWILEGNSEERAAAYYVGDLRERRLWARRVIPGTEENSRFGGPMALIEAHRADPRRREELDAARAAARRQLDEIDRLLFLPAYAALNQKFDFRKNKAKSGREPLWHEVVGAATIAEIATQLGIREEYDVIYAGLCKVTHSREMRLHTHVHEGRIHLLPIRNLQPAHQVFATTMGCAIRFYRRLLEVYRYPELDNFRREYLEGWQRPFLSRVQIEYTFE